MKKTRTWMAVTSSVPCAFVTARTTVQRLPITQLVLDRHPDRRDAIPHRRPNLLLIRRRQYAASRTESTLEDIQTYFCFFSAGLRIWNEHNSDSSTLIIAPALSNSPQ